MESAPFWTSGRELASFSFLKHGTRRIILADFPVNYVHGYYRYDQRLTLQNTCRIHIDNISARIPGVHVPCNNSFRFCIVLAVFPQSRQFSEPNPCMLWYKSKNHVLNSFSCLLV